MRSVVVVGASLAGLSTARALRAAGFDGRLTLVGDEAHAPYDRPPLSKGFLVGTLDQEALALGAPALDENLDPQWVLGTRAVGLDVGATSSTVRLADGSAITADGVVVATGATPRRLIGTDSLAGVHTLRTLDDAIALRADLASPGHVVVIGCGFIGAEVASSARTLGHDVTIVDALPHPFDPQLGRAVATAARRLPGEKGVKLITGVGISRISGGDRVERVTLEDGTVLDADIVVVGIGVVPTTSWLDGSGIECQDGVLTDGYGITNHPRIAAVGDIARYPSARAGRKIRVEHWTNALEMPRTTAAALLGAASASNPAGEAYDPLPYFWSDQYGVKIQAAGHISALDDVEVVEGDLDSRKFTALYTRGDQRVGVVSFSSPKSFTALRRELAEPVTTQETV